MYGIASNKQSIEPLRLWGFLFKMGVAVVGCFRRGLCDDSRAYPKPCSLPKKGQNPILFFPLADFLPDLRLEFFYF